MIVLTQEEKKQAISWLANDGFDLVTVAQHFGLTAEELKTQVHTQG